MNRMHAGWRRASLNSFRSADARVHLDEVGAAGEEERDARFPRDRAREQRLAGSGRADEQDALRNPSADLREAAGLAEEVHQLLDLFLRLVHARHVVERDRGGFAIGLAGLVLERGDASARNPVQREPEHPDEYERDQERAVVVGGRIGRRLHVDADALLRELGNERAVGGDVIGRDVGPAPGAVGPHVFEHVAIDHHARDEAAVEVAQEIREGHSRSVGSRPGARHDDSGGDQQHGGDDGGGEHGTATGPLTKHATLRSSPPGARPDTGSGSE
jgi:hypothetical protein